MLEENISERNGFIRLALGVGITACGIAHLAKENGSRSLGTLFVTAGAMKIAEGIFLYCPAKALMSSNVKDAVTSSMQDFMDGDSLMAAFRSGYESGSAAQSQNASKNSSSNSNSSNNSSMENMVQTASKVAETVEKTTPAGSTMNTAAKTVQTVANSQKNQGTQNKQNGQKQNNKQS